MDKVYKENISSKELEQTAKDASNQAIKEAFALGIPITIQEGNKLIKVFPNGKKEVLKTIDEAFVKLNKNHFKL